MKMLGKIINGVLMTPLESEKKKIVITNPSDELLKLAMNYKDLVYDELPEYDAETQYIEQEYEEGTKVIYVHYTVKDIPIGEITEGDI
jgi:hypothetical protein